MIHKIHYLLLLAATVLTLGGCAKDPVQDAIEGKQINLGLNLGTYASTDINADENETKITEAYVFIFNASGLLENQGNTKVLPSEGGLLVDVAGRLNGTWRVAEGVKDIYVILNPHEVGLWVEGTVTANPTPIDLARWSPSKADLGRLITPASSYANYYYHAGQWSSWPATCTQGMLMTGKMEGVNVTSAAMGVTIPVQRRYARVDISLRRAKELAGTPIILPAKAHAKMLAAQTRLYDGTSPYYLSAIESGQPASFYYPREYLGQSIDLEAIENEDGSGDYQYIFSFYAMPMPYGNGNDWVTAPLEIIFIGTSGPVGGSSPEGLSIPISELDGNNKPDLSRPKDIVANKIYKVNATLNRTTVDVEIKILDWDDQSIQGDIAGSMLSVSQSKVVMDWWNLGQKFDTSVDYASDGTVEFVGYVVKNADGTDASVTTDGSNLPTWLPKAKITNLPDGSAKTGRIGLEYVVTNEITHPDVALRIKTGNITKDIMVVYDNGFVPNNMLQQSGWLASRLPGLGLQATKIGNISPSKEFAASEREFRMLPNGNINLYDIEYLRVLGKKDIGVGPVNTGLFYNIDSEAAASCYAIGPEWFIPSSAEIIVISKERTCYGPSYYMSKNYYWCSSLASYPWASGTTLISGTVAYFPWSVAHTDSMATNRWPVRCVRSVGFSLSTSVLVADWYNWGQSFSTDVLFDSTEGAVSIESIDNGGPTKDWLVSAVLSGTTNGKIRITYQPTASARDVVITLKAASGTVRKLTVQYDNGFIPRSMLQEGGWPEAALPIKGIQRTKRGNQLPELEATEPLIADWSTTATLIGTTETIVGSGMRNTSAIISALGDRALAAKACATLADGRWYLPAVDEWNIPDGVKGWDSFLGRSYRRGRFLYTSSEYSRDRVWSNIGTVSYKVSTENGGRSEYRCIRNM